MLYLGAKGDTKEQMGNLLSIGSNDNLQSLSRLSTLMSGGNRDGGVSINTAANGWLSQEFKILPKFRNEVKKYFGVMFERLNFGQPESARKDINEWVSRHTGRRINDLFPAGSFDAMTKLVLANAIYFKGAWTSPFNKQRTSFRPFHTGSGSQKNVPFMYQGGLFSSGIHRGVELLELPYGTEGEYAMLFAKPIDSSAWFYRRQPGDFADLSTLSEHMTLSLLEKFQESLSETHMDIYVPRFTLKKKIDLKEELQKLGITEVFSPRDADLSPINGQKNLYVSTAKHQAFVQVDEEGTVAAAATGIGISMRMMRPRIQLNRPFLIYIIHKPQNAVLFAGKVVDPSL